MKQHYLGVKSLVVFAALVALAASAPSRAAGAEPSLYERLGGETVIRAISEDIWTNHTLNPIINNRFANSDPVYVKQMVFEIFAASTGGPVEYTGKDMQGAHATMNISDMEFNAVVDDVLKALDMNNIGARERGEVLAILWSVKDQVVNARLTSRALSPAMAVDSGEAAPVAQ
jgi:hemoglobin